MVWQSVTHGLQWWFFQPGVDALKPGWLRSRTRRCYLAVYLIPGAALAGDTGFLCRLYVPGSRRFLPMREITANNLLQCFYLVLQERPNFPHRRRRYFREFRTAAQKQLDQIRVPDTGDDDDLACAPCTIRPSQWQPALPNNFLAPSFVPTSKPAPAGTPAVQIEESPGSR